MSTAAAITEPVDVLVITVYGTPAPQGSKRHVGNGVMVESSKHVKPWREAVKHAALDALDEWRAGWHSDYWTPTIDRPVAVEITFTFARPSGHFGTGRNAGILRDSAPPFPATKKNDVDKLVRSCFDALVHAGVVTDDGLIDDVTARKRYPHTHPDALPSPGAVIRIRELRP